jgi:hypothetical protein
MTALQLVVGIVLWRRRLVVAAGAAPKRLSGAKLGWREIHVKCHPSAKDDGDDD